MRPFVNSVSARSGTMPEHVLCPSSMRLPGAPVVPRRKALLLLPPQQPKVIPWGDDPGPCQRCSDSVTTTADSTGRRYGDVALALAAPVMMVLGNVRILDSAGAVVSDDMETQDSWTPGGNPGFAWVTAAE